VIKFGANILSQTVQRNLGRATLDLSTTSERLASGQRINKASDDAAGLAIAASLNVNARIFTQGVRNLNDGLSAVNIAEGAMGELGGIIVRIEELATQSISETYSDTQRQALQKEATALTAEWNRIVESTSFNGQNLLTGANTRTVLQGGNGTEGTLAVQIGEAQLAGGLEGYGGRGTTRISTNSAGNQQVGGYSYVATLSADGRYVAFYSFATNLVAGDTNGQLDGFIKDTLTGVTTRVSTDSSGNQATGASGVTALSADGRYAAFHSSATNLVAGDTNGLTDSFIKDTLTGVTTRISTDSAGNQATGGYSFVSALSADGRYAAFTSAATNLVAGDTNGQPDVFLRDLTKTGVQTLSGVVVSNKASAKVTLDLAQRYRAELLDYRSKLGATTSRISTFVNTLQSSTINYKAASSRITDADVAEEAAKSIASGIRQQVASSLLGQANQAPQIGLQLLRNA
jgi:flagellin-like hook-associated protein FlgL